MRRSLILSRTPREWNVRALTLDNFARYCAEEQIIIEEVESTQHGMHVIYDDQPYIIINPRLRGPERLFVCFHELAHFWLHPSGIQHYHEIPSVAETEADVVAICALIPITVLNHYWPPEITQLYGYPHKYIEMRNRVRNLYDL